MLTNNVSGLIRGYSGVYTWCCREAKDGLIDLPWSGQSTSAYTNDDGYLQNGEPWPSPRFIEYNSSILIDQVTGLMWQKAPSTELMTWEEAIQYANKATVGGLDDWRVPNINELFSLYHIEMASRADHLTSAGFANIQEGGYWSSSTPYDNSARSVNFAANENYFNKVKTDTGYVLLVRGVH
jgi:hypothetical protein